MHNRREFFRRTIGVTACLLAGKGSANLKAASAKRPNFLWLSAEDFSPHLGCYGDKNAKSPTIDQFAKEGILFTHAFTVHGVCAPVRSSIISGMYPSSIGSCAMRSTAAIESPICFTQALRQAGYYCTNNSKEDYNFKTPKSAWDVSGKKAHYLKRPEDKPFFAVFNFTGTHESQLWNSADFENTHPRGLSKSEYQDPSKMVVPPFYPDTPVIRQDLARLYERITQFDYFVKEKLAELKSAGLEEDTIVFIWSDHGDGLPRSKRCLYDTGTRVPLLMRIPKRFRGDNQYLPGSKDDRLINMFQLGPTVLNFAGVAPLPRMQAKPFLGPNYAEQSQYIFGARDRIDEFFDLVRSVRDRKYRYLRNLNPWIPYFPRHEYGDKCNTLRQMRQIQQENSLSVASARLMANVRPSEELYDLDNDPYEINNLADDSAYSDVKCRLQKAMSDWMIEVRDTGLLPEPVLRSRSRVAGSAYAVLHDKGGQELTRRLIELAIITSNPKSGDKPVLLESTTDSDAAVRYWAITGLGWLKEKESICLQAIKNAAMDSDACVRVAAARSLNWLGENKAALRILRQVLTTENDEDVLHFCLNTLDFMGPDAISAVRDCIRKLANSTRSEGYAKKITAEMLSQISN